MNPDVPKFMSGNHALKYFGLYMVGLLPFVHIYEDVSSLPFMTRDYLNMKIIEAKTLTWKYYLYIVSAVLANYIMNPMLIHMNKRGIFTNYWVINDDDEVFQVMRDTPVRGIMTDRPARLQQIVKYQAQVNDIYEQEIRLV